MDFNVKNNKCNYIIEARKWYECAKNDILNGKEPQYPPDDVINGFILQKIKNIRVVVDVDMPNGCIRTSILKDD